MNPGNLHPYHLQESHESVASKLMSEEEMDENKDTPEDGISVETEEGDDAAEVTERTSSESSVLQDEYVNPRGVRFTPQEPPKEGIQDFLPFFQGLFENSPFSEVVHIQTVPSANLFHPSSLLEQNVEEKRTVLWHCVILRIAQKFQWGLFFLGAGPLVPYGLPSVRELFRFLISLINPQDR